MPEQKPETLHLLAWAFARDMASRQGGKAGYLVSEERHYLIIDIPSMGMGEQAVFLVPQWFYFKYTLPAYVGSIHDMRWDETTDRALTYYGNYITVMRQLLPAPGS